MKKVSFFAISLLMTIVFACSKEDQDIHNINPKNPELSVLKSSTLNLDSIPFYSGTVHNEALLYIDENWTLDRYNFPGYSQFNNELISINQSFSVGKWFEVSSERISLAISIRDELYDIGLDSIDVNYMLDKFNNKLDSLMLLLNNSAEVALISDLKVAMNSFIETNNSQEFSTAIEALNTSWYSESFSITEDNFDGIYAGVLIGIAKYSFEYWEDELLDLPVAPWVLADVTGAALSGIGYSLTNIITGNDMRVGDVVTGMIVDGLITSAGFLGAKWLKRRF